MTLVAAAPAQRPPLLLALLHLLHTCSALDQGKPAVQEYKLQAIGVDGLDFERYDNRAHDADRRVLLNPTCAEL